MQWANKHPIFEQTLTELLHTDLQFEQLKSIYLQGIKSSQKNTRNFESTESEFRKSFIRITSIRLCAPCENGLIRILCHLDFTPDSGFPGVMMIYTTYTNYFPFFLESDSNIPVDLSFKSFKRWHSRIFLSLLTR